MQIHAFCLVFLERYQNTFLQFFTAKLWVVSFALLSYQGTSNNFAVFKKPVKFVEVYLLEWDPWSVTAGIKSFAPFSLCLYKLCSWKKDESRNAITSIFVILTPYNKTLILE